MKNDQSLRECMCSDIWVRTLIIPISYDRAGWTARILVGANHICSSVLSRDAKFFRRTKQFMIRSWDIASHQPAQIRRATPLDISSIVAVEKELFIDPWEQAIFLDALTYYPSTYFVAVCEGRVVGFVVGGLEDTGENIYGHLCNLGVTASYQHRGIGRLLLNRIEHQYALELASGVQLEVRSSNTRAQQFYRNLGYRDVFRLAHYYSSGEDAVVMMKWFRF